MDDDCDYSHYIVDSDSETIVEEKPLSSFPEVAIGIDIGTSQCRVGFWNGIQVELLSNTRNQKLFRSFVTFKNNVAAVEVTNQHSHKFDMLSGAAIFNIKRLIGRVDTDPVVHASKTLPFLVQTLDIGVRPFIAALVNNEWQSMTVEEVLAIFLVELRAMAETTLKKPIRNVVLTVPVSFSRFQLTRIERACAIAGLKVLRLIHEPTAVAMLYASQQEHQAGEDILGIENEKIALIFNIGAGYCDVAVTTTSGGISEIMALAGSCIGGEDILQNTMHYLLPDSKNLISGDISSMGLLRVTTQDAIHQLSSQTSVQINVYLGNGVLITRIITREEFEAVNHEVFEKCDNLVRQCLHDANVEVDNVDDVILVGGCSSIPKIRKLVTDICKKKEIYQGMNPFEAAVRGATLECAVASGISDPFGILELLTIQVAPFGIGIRANGDSFIPIIPRYTRMPGSKEAVFTTVNDNQTEALILVYEGEREKAMENHLLGFFKVVGIPAAPKGVAEINVCMDINGYNVLRVMVEVVMPGSHQVAAPMMKVKMPTVDDGHGWCAEALNRTYGSSLDLITLPEKPLDEMPMDI